MDIEIEGIAQMDQNRKEKRNKFTCAFYEFSETSSFGFYSLGILCLCDSNKSFRVGVI